MTRRGPTENLKADGELAKTARLLHELAIELDEPEIAQRALSLEHRARELVTHDRLRAAGYFEGGGYSDLTHRATHAE